MHNINRRKLKIIFAIYVLLITCFIVPSARADEKVYIDTKQRDQTSVQSLNSIEINNDVSVKSNTGNNSVSNSTSGSAVIKTGDISQESNVSNNVNTNNTGNHDNRDSYQNNNKNKADINNINGNGADSENNIKIQEEQTNQTSVINRTIIKNRIDINEDTGNNSAENSGGNVRIETGDIKSKVNVVNSPVGTTNINIPENKQNDTSISNINNNGSESKNKIEKDNTNNGTVSAVNDSQIKNEIHSNSDTGNNKADGNSGSVVVATGNIIEQTDIQNSSNINITQTTGGDNKDAGGHNSQNEPQPAPNLPLQQTAPLPGTIINPQLSSANITPNFGPAGSLTATADPTFGKNSIFFSRLSNNIMMFLGAYLRLHSGNSPPTA